MGIGTARGGDYAAVADHYRQIQMANSGRPLILRRYDRPAGDESSRTEGPQAQKKDLPGFPETTLERSGVVGS
ncbi:hypothetical protein [Streptomyces niveus]|uniref:hypothetical protein n=1 Tax=Streptomyces niveus TaxID=193462 RepID=UPI003443DD27